MSSYTGNASSRTQMKLLLQKQQMESEFTAPQNVPVSQPSVFVIAPANISDPQVSSSLENPTRFHIQQLNLQRQSDKKIRETRHSLPTVSEEPVYFNKNTNEHSQYAITCNSYPDNALHASHQATGSPSIDDPTSTGTSFSEEITDLSDLLGLSTVFNDSNADDLGISLDADQLEPSLPCSYSTTPFAATIPHGDVFEMLPKKERSETLTSSNSCPAIVKVEPPMFLTEQERANWVKERHKKDNHNMIERRRRYNINDRIKEIASLLPKSQEFDFKNNKGSILRASVEYIQKLQKDQTRLQVLEKKHQKLESEYRKMAIKVQEMEAFLREKFSQLVPTQTPTHPVQDQYSGLNVSVNPADIIMDVEDSGVVLGDPNKMLASPAEAVIVADSPPPHVANDRLAQHTYHQLLSPKQQQQQQQHQQGQINRNGLVGVGALKNPTAALSLQSHFTAYRGGSIGRPQQPQHRPTRLPYQTGIQQSQQVTAVMATTPPSATIPYAQEAAYLDDLSFQ